MAQIVKRYGYQSSTNEKHDQIIVSLNANEEDERTLIELIDHLLSLKLGKFAYSKERLSWGTDRCVTFFSDEDHMYEAIDLVNKFFDMDYLADRICYY